MESLEPFELNGLSYENSFENVLDGMFALETQIQDLSPTKFSKLRRDFLGWRISNGDASCINELQIAIKNFLVKKHTRPDGLHKNIFEFPRVLVTRILIQYVKITLINWIQFFIKGVDQF